MTPSNGILLVAFGVLTVIIGLMTLLAGSLRDLTRTRRRAFGIGGLLLVFLGCAAAFAKTRSPAARSKPRSRQLRLNRRAHSYFASAPWAAPLTFRPGETVLLIGAGLTMVDVATAALQTYVSRRRKAATTSRWFCTA